MPDNSASFGPFRVSYSYKARYELPGDMGTFYAGAGQAKDAFTLAHDAQIKPPVPERFREREAARRGGHVISDPHPSYALPHGRTPDEDWFQTIARDRSGKVLSREAFRKMRQDQNPIKRRDHDQNIRRR